MLLEPRDVWHAGRGYPSLFGPEVRFSAFGAAGRLAFVDRYLGSMTGLLGRRTQITPKGPSGPKDPGAPKGPQGPTHPRGPKGPMGPSLGPKEWVPTNRSVEAA